MEAFTDRTKLVEDRAIMSHEIQPMERLETVFHLTCNGQLELGERLRDAPD